MTQAPAKTLSPTKVYQWQKIVALLSDRAWHSTVALNAICWRYGARLWDLREKGYVFDKRPTSDPAIEEWRLISTPEQAALAPHLERTAATIAERRAKVGGRAGKELASQSGRPPTNDAVGSGSAASVVAQPSGCTTKPVGRDQQAGRPSPTLYEQRIAERDRRLRELAETEPRRLFE